jgi:heat shock protein HtpX
MIFATPVPPKITIAPRRSMTLFALLAIAMVIASYVFIIVLAATCVYLPYWILARLEILQFQILLLLLGGVLAAAIMLWSILPRRDKFVAPGPLLKREYHPQLFAEMDGIADSLGELLPREVYLTNEVNAFVVNRGGILGFGSHRIMGIGFPLLSVLSVSEFRAILAHEFAHYYSGDTTLGPFVYRTQTAIARAFKNVGSLAEGDGIHLIRALSALVSLALQQYFAFFLRVTKFVSRKKEFRADELACLVAGAGPLKRGLQKIESFHFAWLVYWATEIEPLLKQSCIPAVAEGFAQFLLNLDIQSEQRETGDTNTDPLDSHPPLQHRINAIERLRVRPTDENSVLALSLLEGLESVELQLVAFTTPKLDHASLRRITWDNMGAMITIPAWKAAADEHSSLLQGVTVSAIPDLIAKLGDGTHMPDPPGMLLSRQQRIDRVRQFLAPALALALLDKNWQLEAKPGVFYFCRGDERANPFVMVNDLVDGKTSAETWIDTCTKLGIADSALAPAVSPVSTD